MTLLILSDSHGKSHRIADIIARVRPDGILFAGDGVRDLAACELPCPLRAVAGNCDTSTLPIIVGGRALEVRDEELITVDGIRILLMHGHRYGVKSTLTPAVSRAASLGADVLVFGHTHAPLEMTLMPDNTWGIPLQKPLTLVNPGTLGGYPPTFATLTVRNGQILVGHGEV